MRYNPELALQFPDESIGMVATERRGTTTYLDSDWDYWPPYIEAKGEVRVARRKRLWLKISENHKEAFTCLRNIPPRALYGLGIVSAPYAQKFAKEAQRFYNLRSLSIQYCSRLKPVFECLSSWPHLRSLNLSRGKTEFICDIENHKALTELWLYRTQVGDDLIRTTTNVQQLKTLDVRDSAITAACFSMFPRSLVKLYMGETNMMIGPHDFDRLHLPNLQELNLVGLRVDPECLSALRKLRSLKRIWLSGTQLTDGDWPTLFSNTSLEHIRVEVTNIGDEGAHALSKVKSLKCVLFYDSPLTDLGALSLAARSNIEELSFDRTDVTDKTADAVMRNGYVRRLDLRFTAVTDDGFVNAAHATELTDLHIEHTSVSDSSLGYLVSAPRLKKLFCSNTNVTAAGVEAFRARVPGCRVYWSHRG